MIYLDHFDYNTIDSKWLPCVFTVEVRDMYLKSQSHGISFVLSELWQSLVGHILIYLNKPSQTLHDDVIKWKHIPRNWPFVRGSPVKSPHKGQWRGALMFSLIFTRINGWVNNCEAGDLRRYRAHYGVTVMSTRRRIVPFVKSLRNEICCVVS